MPNTKTRNSKLKKPARGVRSLLFDKRAISTLLSTIILTAGVIAGGIAILYWAYSWGNAANQQYSDSTSASMSAIQERIAFEYITYSSINPSITVYLINCGTSNNVSVTRVYVWDNTSTLLPSNDYSISPLYNITTSHEIPNNSLNVGEDGYFNINITISQGLGSSGSYYTLRVVTGRGRNFDGSFSLP